MNRNSYAALLRRWNRDFFLAVPRAGILREWKGCVVPSDPSGREDQDEPAPLLPA
jgi:hypothetical protein